MPNYNVELNGQNFLIEFEGDLALHGFYTFRYVEAADPQQAELAAVQMLREQEGLRELVQNPPDDPPIMDVTRIVEAEFDAATVQQPGLVWYLERRKRWWQFWKK